MSKTIDEINEETENNLKIDKEKRWKDNQLDRIEKKVDRTLNIVRAIGFYSLLVAFALLYYIFNHWMEKSNDWKRDEIPKRSLWTIKRP